MNKEDRKLMKLIRTQLMKLNKSIDMLIDFSRDDLRRLKIIEDKLGIKDKGVFTN